MFLFLATFETYGKGLGGGGIIERNSLLFESIPYFGLLVKCFESPLTFLKNLWTFESGRAEAEIDPTLSKVA